MTNDDMFDPLPGARKTPRRRRQAETWTAIVPVPKEAPPAPPKHFKRGKPARIETYRDAGGDVIGFIDRFDLPAGEKEFLPLTYCRHSDHGRREWRWRSWPPPRPLYGLDRLAARPEATVILVEGEKAADAAAQLLPEHVAVTTPGDSQAAGKANWSPVARRRVVIWPDADEPGRKYAAAARALGAVAATVTVITPTEGVAPGWDAADALAEGWDAERSRGLVDSARPPSEVIGAPVAAKRPARERTAPDAGDGRRRATQSEKILALIEGVELWHSPDHEAHATVPSNGHSENWPIRNKGFRLWLSGRYYETHDGAPGSQAVEDATRVMEAVAIHKGPEFPVFLRVGEHDGAVYLDLTNDHWQAVRITGAGWETVDRPPIKFLRTPAMLPLPAPEPGGSLEPLNDLVNLRSEGDLKLLVAWMVGAFRPRGPYPILVLGASKAAGIRSCPGSAANSSIRTRRRSAARRGTSRTWWSPRAIAGRSCSTI